MDKEFNLSDKMIQGISLEGTNVILTNNVKEFIKLLKKEGLIYNMEGVWVLTIPLNKLNKLAGKELANHSPLRSKLQTQKLEPIGHGKLNAPEDTPEAMYPRRRIEASGTNDKKGCGEK